MIHWLKIEKIEKKWENSEQITSWMVRPNAFFSLEPGGRGWSHLENSAYLWENPGYAPAVQHIIINTMDNEVLLLWKSLYLLGSL